MERILILVSVNAPLRLVCTSRTPLRLPEISKKVDVISLVPRECLLGKPDCKVEHPTRRIMPLELDQPSGLEEA